jgi:hypothetical protein
MGTNLANQAGLGVLCPGSGLTKGNALKIESEVNVWRYPGAGNVKLDARAAEKWDELSGKCLIWKAVCVAND